MGNEASVSLRPHLMGTPVRIVVALASVLVLTVEVACGPAAPPAPTKDVPTFADGEAIAVVKTWLSGMTWDSVQTITNRISGRGRVGSRGTPVVDAVAVQHNCLRQYLAREYEWSSEYMGHGVWSVTAALDPEQSSEWRVYEGTAAVDPIQSAFRTC